MGEEKKRTVREIIENYDGAAVRIMESVEHIHTRFFAWESVNSFRHRSN